MQQIWLALIFGLMLGWVIEWVIDWQVWRKRMAALHQENEQLRRQLAATATAVTPATELAALPAATEDFAAPEASTAPPDSPSSSPVESPPVPPEESPAMTMPLPADAASE